MKWLGVAAAAVLSASAGQAHATYINLVQNWSFEQGAFGPTDNGAPSDWTVNGTGESYSEYYLWNNTDGQHTFGFGGPGNRNGLGTSISQTIVTAPGQTYTLRFGLAETSDCCSATVTAAFGDQTMTGTAFGFDGYLTQPYYYFIHDFVADSALTVLSFTETGATRGTDGGVLDRVEVLPPGSAVPEPSAWALMMLGIGGLGAALRTRTRLRLALA